MLEPDRKIRDYILEKKIGQGGMGEVWLARHFILDKKAAIKILTEGLDQEEDFAARFVDEAKAMALLQHPNIIGINEFFVEDGVFFLVMPYCDGGPLTRRLQEVQGPLPIPEAVSISLDILGALNHAHEKGIIHRDVKPANILLDQTGRAFLVDFGISLMSGVERRTRVGVSLGTPHYISPEQLIRPRTIDHRADLYSFGCVLYEMLAGHPPFKMASGVSAIEFLVKQGHLFKPPPPIQPENPAVNAALEAVVLRSMEKEPDNRFATGAAFAEALRVAARAKDVPPAAAALLLTSPSLPTETIRVTGATLRPAPGGPAPPPSAPRPVPAPAPPLPRPAEPSFSPPPPRPAAAPLPPATTRAMSGSGSASGGQQPGAPPENAGPRACPGAFPPAMPSAAATLPAYPLPVYPPPPMAFPPASAPKPSASADSRPPVPRSATDIVPPSPRSALDARSPGPPPVSAPWAAVPPPGIDAFPPVPRPAVDASRPIAPPSAVPPEPRNTPVIVAVVGLIVLFLAGVVALVVWVSSRQTPGSAPAPSPGTLVEPQKPVVAEITPSGPPLQESERYVDAANGFSVVLPPGWNTRQGEGGEMLVATHPTEREGISVTGEDLPREMTPGEYLQIAEPQLKKQFETVSIYGRRELTINGRPAAWIEFNCTSASGGAGTGVVYAFVEGCRAISFICMSAPERFSAFRPTVEKVTGSFRFEKRP